MSPGMLRRDVSRRFIIIYYLLLLSNVGVAASNRPVFVLNCSGVTKSRDAAWRVLLTYHSLICK